MVIRRPGMPDEPAEPTENPEVRTIRQLVRLMQRYDLTAIDLGEGPAKIRLRRRGATAPPPPAAPVQAPPAPTSTPASAVAAPAPEPAGASPGVSIESPMVGTFYASGAPDAPPFVQVGSAIRPETTVCVIEAMKVFTDIPAGVSGTIAEVLVKNGQPVEFGQPLFRVSQE